MHTIGRPHGGWSSANTTLWTQGAGRPASVVPRTLLGGGRLGAGQGDAQEGRGERQRREELHRRSRRALAGEMRAGLVVVGNLFGR